MKINYSNQELIDSEIHIHDSVFEKIEFNYNDDILFIRCKDRYYNKMKDITFKNVIYLEMQNCNFWCDDVSREIVNWELVDGKATLKRLKESEENRQYNSKKLTTPCIESCFIMTTGNKITILCEEIELEEINM